MATATPADFIERIRVIAQNSGAQEVEVFAEVTTINEVRIRGHEVELLQQSVLNGVGLRVLRDSKIGFMYTTDYEPADINELILRTVALAAEATPREENRFPNQPLPAQGFLDIYDDTIPPMTPLDLVPIARAVEQGAIASDKRIQTVRDARAGVSTREVYFTNTYIQYQTYASTTCWRGCTAVATQGSIQREGSFMDRRRIYSDLTTPDRVGQLAARRALGKLGAKPVPTTKAPVIFEAEAAGGFLQGLFNAFNGANAIEGRTFLAGRRGQVVASPLLTIVDDGILRRGLGSLPFDGEGTQTRRNVVLDRGVFVKFLHTAYTARRMDVPATGSAIRAYDSLPVVGPTNFYAERGGSKLDGMIKETARGLYVTGTAGFGMDTVSGEYSQQAEGFWIENGTLGAPVDGVTVAGKLDDLLLGIDAVGKDLEYRSQFSSPSIRFKEMTIGGT
jgi:PmbA protein